MLEISLLFVTPGGWLFAQRPRDHISKRYGTYQDGLCKDFGPLER